MPESLKEAFEEIWQDRRVYSTTRINIWNISGRGRFSQIYFGDKKICLQEGRLVSVPNKNKKLGYTKTWKPRLWNGRRF